MTDITNKQLLKILRKDFATKKYLDERLKVFATKDDLQGFATKEDLLPFATKDDLQAFATKDDFAELRKEQLQQSITLNKIEQKLDGVSQELDVVSQELDGVSQVVETIADNYATHDDIAELDHKLDHELASNKSWRKALARAAAQ